MKVNNKEALSRTENNHEGQQGSHGTSGKEAADKHASFPIEIDRNAISKINANTAGLVLMSVGALIAGLAGFVLWAVLVFLLFLALYISALHIILRPLAVLEQDALYIRPQPFFSPDKIPRDSISSIEFKKTFNKTIVIHRVDGSTYRIRGTSIYDQDKPTLEKYVSGDLEAFCHSVSNGVESEKS